MKEASLNYKETKNVDKTTEITQLFLPNKLKVDKVNMLLHMMNK